MEVPFILYPNLLQTRELVGALFRARAQANAFVAGARNRNR